MAAGPKLAAKLGLAAAGGRLADGCELPLCIAQDHQIAALHSSGLDICPKSIVIMGLRYANPFSPGAVALE
jgi:hypothetical protein